MGGSAARLHSLMGGVEPPCSVLLCTSTLGALQGVCFVWGLQGPVPMSANSLVGRYHEAMWGLQSPVPHSANFLVGGIVADYLWLVLTAVLVQHACVDLRFNACLLS